MQTTGTLRHRLYQVWPSKAILWKLAKAATLLGLLLASLWAFDRWQDKEKAQVQEAEGLAVIAQFHGLLGGPGTKVLQGAKAKDAWAIVYEKDGNQFIGVRLDGQWLQVPLQKPALEIPQEP